MCTSAGRRLIPGGKIVAGEVAISRGRGQVGRVFLSRHLKRVLERRSNLLSGSVLFGSTSLCLGAQMWSG